MHATILYYTLLSLAGVAHSHDYKYLSDDYSVADDGVHIENNRTHSHAIVKKLYGAHADNIDIGSTFSFVTGGIYMAGYYSFLGGGTQIRNTIDDCKGINGVADGFQCANSAIQATTGHVLSAFIGGTHGAGAAAFIANVAAGAVGLNPGNNQLPGRDLSARDCPARVPFTSDSYWPSGTQGWKVSAENTCINVLQSEADTASRLSGQLPTAMEANDAKAVQATIWEGDSPNNVLARLTIEVVDGTPDTCAAYISGQGCHYNP